MFLPLRTDSPLRSTPYMNWLLILANVLMFAAQQAMTDLTDRLGLSPHTPTILGFFTYQFAHANLLHLLGNMLFLYIFGNNVNDKMGHVGYLAFYLAGGVVAGIAYVLTQHGAAPIIGASGSIAAVTGAYLILFPRSHVTIVYWYFIIGRYELQSLWVIAFFFAKDVFFNFAGQDNVAHMAHIGGTLFGCAVCLPLLVAHLLPRDQFDVWALIQRWNKRRQYRDMVSKGYNPFDHTKVGGGSRRATTPAVDGRVQEMRHQINAELAAKQMAVAADLYVQMMLLDVTQVLARQSQLDVATQLHHEGRYTEAAAAYEKLLSAYPKLERSEQVHLMLGVLYARYLHEYAKAKPHLTKVVDRLHQGREVDLAREELTIIESRAMPTRT